MQLVLNQYPGHMLQYIMKTKEHSEHLKKNVIEKHKLGERMVRVNVPASAVFTN